MLLGVLVVCVPGALGEPPAEWSEAEAVVLVEDLNMPTNIDVAPDGSVWYAEIDGNVSGVDPTTGETETMYRLEQVVTGGERGLVGMALGADFAENGTFYLYYTAKTGDAEEGVNRLVRVVDGDETELAIVPAAEEHNGGRILVTPDGTLFVGTGENQLRDPAQDPDGLLGKVLRMTSEGEPVEGNLDGLVYSMGHRNVYGLAWNPETQSVWATENSGWRRDEVNVLEAGANFGYPECEGYHLNGVDDPCPTDKGYTFPIATFYEDDAAAPTGAVFWQGEFYWASFNEASIHHLEQDPDTGAWNDTVVFEHEAPILDLQVGPEGGLYVSTIDGVWRLLFPGEEWEHAQAEGGDDGGDPTQPASGPASGLVEGVPSASLILLLSVLAAAALLAQASRTR